MFKVSVFVTPKAGIMDPQGAVIERALPQIGFEGVGRVRVGRFITLEVDSWDEEAARKDVEAMCRQLLANPIIEDFSFELERLGPSAGDGDVILPTGSGTETRPPAAPSPWTVADPYASKEGEVE